jgi:predicted lipoprotein with Yx(FWY)xxD motif
MKRILFTLIMLMAFTAMQAQKISYIETTRSWHYVYDEKGKKIHTFSTSQGEVVAYSESFYIVKNGSWYYTCDAKGKKLHTFAVSNVGDILSATGDTFTSRKGSWIYTWDKNGKKIATRSASH